MGTTFCLGKGWGGQGGEEEERRGGVRKGRWEERGSKRGKGRGGDKSPAWSYQNLNSTVSHPKIIKSEIILILHNFNT